MQRIFLDNNSTTRPLPEVIDAVSAVSTASFANPGSRHCEGRVARRALEDARERIAAVLGARPREVVFTSGGTESINLAILGLAAETPGTILLTPGEHSATLEACRELQRRGWRLCLLDIDAEGRLVEENLDALPWNQVKLATIILAHNETGVVQDISRLAARCRQRAIPLHVDAVQAVGKMPVDFQDLDVAALSLAAHKFHGPRGIGALLLREGAGLRARQLGGHQESDRRAGTESVALAVGMAVALERWQAERQPWSAKLRNLRDRLEQGLASRCAPVVINGSREFRLPNTVNVAFPGVDGEALARRPRSGGDRLLAGQRLRQRLDRAGARPGRDGPRAGNCRLFGPFQRRYREYDRRNRRGRRSDRALREPLTAFAFRGGAARLTLGETVSQEGLRGARSTRQATHSCRTNREAFDRAGRACQGKSPRSPAARIGLANADQMVRLASSTCTDRRESANRICCGSLSATHSATIQTCDCGIVRPPEFVADLSDAQSRHRQAEFEAEYVALDLLILEDLAGIQGRMSAQRMLVVLIDELKRTGGRVIVTCTSLPGQLKNVIPRLVSRLRGGLCVPLELLDESSRLSFARHFAASRQIPLPPQARGAARAKGPATPRELLAALVNFDLGARRKQHQRGLPRS